MRDRDPLPILESLLAKAKAAGADSADAIFLQGQSLAIGERLGVPEKLERAEEADLGLRVFIGQRQAVVSTGDISPAALARLAERAIAMARAVPEDPYCGLADRAALARDFPDLDCLDPQEPAIGELTSRLRAAEAAALAVPGIANSEGAEAGWMRHEIALATSHGFAGRHATSAFSLSVSVLAKSANGMERDYDFTSATHLADLEDAAAIGERAGHRAVRRLDPRKPKTAKLPIVFEPRIAGGFLGMLASAINGATIARGTSFLKEKLGAAVFAPGIRILDDPHRRRGSRSLPFDAEGLPTRSRAIVEDGILQTWLLDCRSARQLGLLSTGHARRSAGGLPGPGPSNLYLAPGKRSPASLIGDIDSGLYVTETIGHGVNLVTGDFSRGASGFWIEKGEIAYPVAELTIAGNLAEMFRNLTPADDLAFKYGIDAPSLRIEGMTIAGA